MKRQDDTDLRCACVRSALLTVALGSMLFVSGCGPKKVSDAEGKAMMASFKGGPESSTDRAEDAKRMQEAADYRKAHPEQFPEPKFNVPAGGKSEVQGGP